MDFSAEHKYSLVVEGNNQNLELGCKPVETGLEGKNHLGVERVPGKWGPTKSDKLGT